MKTLRGLHLLTALPRSGLVTLLFVAACSGGGGTATEDVCDDGLDDDNDGLVDCDDPDCASDPVCAMQPEACTGGVDEDGDGLIDCEDPDCFEDPVCYDVDDAADLPGPHGDPALDIDKVGVDLTGGVATLFMTFEGAWPPDSTFYSWFLRFEITNDGNSTVAMVIVQRHDGVEATNATGIPAGNVTLRQTPEGVWVRMTGVPGTGEKYYVESGVQKTNPGTRVTDVAVDSPQPLP